MSKAGAMLCRELFGLSKHLNTTFPVRNITERFREKLKIGLTDAIRA